MALALTAAALMSAGNRASGLDGDAVLVGAGDVASCNSNGDEETAALINDIPGTVAAFGDNAYENGSLSEYNDCYDPSSSWGGFKARTMPSLGNHEYQTPGASGYFDYFSATPSSPVPSPGLTPGKGYYSYDLGSWHVVVLNSNCADVSGGCAAGSPQEKWLRDDLAAHQNACTLAYWHHPRFTSAKLGNNTAVTPFWKALYDAGAEVVLNGHAHVYEVFDPQNPNGGLDQAKGIREFVVGTGGKSLNAFNTTKPNSDVRLNTYNGVIKLTLHPNSYDWQFVTTSNVPVRDSGSGTCHGGTTPPPTDDTTPPTVKSTVPASGATGVSLTTDVTATFSEEMDPKTLVTTPTDLANPNVGTSTTFKLRVKGSTTNIPATVSYDPATNTATLNPTDSLQKGITYKAIVTTAAEDLAGNRLDQKASTAGLQQKGWTFTVSN